jgi:ferredoxin
MARVGPPEGDEADLIPWLDAPQANSRLACQIRLTVDLDGLRVWIPGEL